MPLISSEESAEHLELNKCDQKLKSYSKLCRTNSKLKLFLSKGLLCALGVLLFAAGCILLVSFQHSDVDEMCLLDNGYVSITNGTSTSVVSTIPPASSMVLTTLPSPTSTESTLIAIDQLQTLTGF